MALDYLVHQLVMAIAKMETTMLNANMMGLIVVEQMSIQNIAWNVLVTVSTKYF